MANATHRGRIIVNDTDYTGSFVDPNPSGIATENLDTVSIDGKIFNVVGSGGGITTYRGLTNPPITLGNEGDIYYKCNGNIVDNYVLIDSTELPADFKFESGVLLSVTIPNGATKIKLNCYNYGQSPTEIILDFLDIPMTNDHPYSGGSQGVQVFSTLWAGKDNDYIYFESAVGAYVWVASGYFDIPIYTYTDIIASYNKTNLGWIGSPEYIEDVYVNNESVLDANRIAQIFSHQEVTEQEYGALPSTKESDNIMYCVKGSRPSTNGNYFQPIIYSTEEREIGVWKDNKPLYAKTYNFNSFVRIANSGADISQYIDNRNDIEILVRGEGFSDDITQAIQSTALWVGYSTRGVIMAYCAEGATVNCVTLYYTKTTDVAGSGSYTTLGVPAHHYDSNEKIVGTYFDETLYEKTIHITEASEVATNQYTTEIQSLNADKIFLVNARVKLGSIANGMWINTPYFNSVTYNTSIGVTNTEITVVATGWNYTEVELTIQYTKTS